MRKKNKKINAAIIIIGNEILSGRTIDQNVSYLASWLNSSVGIKLEEVRIIPDVQSVIVKTVLSLKFFANILELLSLIKSVQNGKSV